MSWQDYVNNLVLSGHIDCASIISAAGDSVWAASENLKLLPDEATTLALLLTADVRDNVVQNAYAKGIYVAGQRYVATRIEGRSIYGRQGRTGVCVVKTKLAFVIGHYGEHQQAGNAAKVVEALADHLISVNY